jgi:signal transduction histidine kinase
MKSASRACLAELNHGVRAPLNGILGFAQLLEREALTEDQLRMVQSIREAGQSLLLNLNDILAAQERDSIAVECRLKR